ncbi:MAG: hypothetical protein ABI218_09745 [Caldimonas sp.]
MSIPSRTILAPADEEAARDACAAWYRQPIVWLASAVLAASLAGCVWLIVVAERNVDPPLPVEELQILKMPLTRPLSPRPASSP